MHIAIINGPNLQCIGSREVDIYGTHTMEEFLGKLGELYPQLKLSYTQSHYEGDIITALYRCAEEADCHGIILNAGAYTHTSIAILDAIRAIALPVVEVHLSNIYARETYRHKSLIAEACWGQITGFGIEGYRLALEALLSRNPQGCKHHKDI